MFTQQGALCTSSADTHPLTYAHAHERAISRHAPFHPMWASHQRQPACISHHLSPRCSLFHLFSFFRFFFLLEGSSRGIPSGRFSFKWLDYGHTYNNNNNNNTFKYTAYLFWIFCFFSPPRICWITPAPQEVAQGSLSLFREPWHDKSHLMSVSVSFPFLAADFICVKKNKNVRLC